MKVTYTKGLTGWTASLTHDDGSDFLVLGARADAYGVTKQEAKATLQDLLGLALQYECRKWTQALNLVTRSKP